MSADPPLPKSISEVAGRLRKEAQETALLNAELHTANIKIEALTLELAHHRRMSFGAKAAAFEQRDPFQETWDADLADLEARFAAQVEVDAPRKQRPRAGRQPPPYHLERVVHPHEPDPCTCGHCGAHLFKIGADITEQLDDAIGMCAAVTVAQGRQAYRDGCDGAQRNALDRVGDGTAKPADCEPERLNSGANLALSSTAWV